MKELTINRIAGNGLDALYCVYIDRERVAEALTIDEVINFLAEKPLTSTNDYFDLPTEKCVEL